MVVVFILDYALFACLHQNWGFLYSKFLQPRPSGRLFPPCPVLTFFIRFSPFVNHLFI